MRAIDGDILKKKLKDAINMCVSIDTSGLSELKAVLEDVEEMPTIEPEPHWIPFKRRKPTEEEGTAFDYIMDCKCPEDGQNILVSINIQGHESVQYDTFYGGGGEECFLESGYELVQEATAWMPLPEPYKEGES